MYDSCGPATVIAKQISQSDLKNSVTFSKWNANDLSQKNRGLIYGGEEGYGDMCCVLFCPKFDGKEYSEPIDYCADGYLSIEEFFKHREEPLIFYTWLYRIIGFNLAIFGLFILLVPLASRINFIPLLTLLVAKSSQFAPLIFALIAGVTLSMMWISLAWIIYRPLLAITILVFSGVANYMIFFYDFSQGVASAPSV